MYLHTYMYIGVVGAKCIVVSWRASPSPLQDKASILLLLPLAHFIPLASPCVSSCASPLHRLSLSPSSPFARGLDTAHLERSLDCMRYKAYS